MIHLRGTLVRSVAACLGDIRRVFAVSAAVLLGALAIQTFLKDYSDWLQTYVGGGRELLAGVEIYGTTTNYSYPPFMAVVAAPFSFVPEWASRLGWFLLSAVSLVVAVEAAWKLAGGRSLRSLPSHARADWQALALGLAFGLTYVLNAFAHQQSDVMIAALVIGGAAVVHAGRNLAGGALLGVAAACKATPLLWAPYLVLRRRWIAAFALLVTLLAGSLAADLISQPPGGGLWLGEWIDRYVIVVLRPGTDAGLWLTNPLYNQSLVGTIQRLLNTVPARGDDGIALVQTAVLAPRSVKLVAYTILLALVVVSVAVGMRARKHQWETAGGLPDCKVFEFSIVVVLMLLMSPMTATAHFAVALLPAFCLARTAVLTGDRVLWGILAAAIVLTLPLNKDLVGDVINFLVLWSGATTACALLLWAGCIRVLWRGQGAAAA